MKSDLGWAILVTLKSFLLTYLQCYIEESQYFHFIQPIYTFEELELWAKDKK
jgi:hypothetical protein